MTKEQEADLDAFIRKLAARGISVPCEEAVAAWRDAKRLRSQAARVRLYLDTGNG